MATASQQAFSRVRPFIPGLTNLGGSTPSKIPPYLRKSTAAKARLQPQTFNPIISETKTQSQPASLASNNSRDATELLQERIASNAHNINDALPGTLTAAAVTGFHGADVGTLKQWTGDHLAEHCAAEREREAQQAFKQATDGLPPYAIDAIMNSGMRFDDPKSILSEVEAALEASFGEANAAALIADLEDRAMARDSGDGSYYGSYGDTSGSGSGWWSASDWAKTYGPEIKIGGVSYDSRKVYDVITAVRNDPDFRGQPHLAIAAASGELAGSKVGLSKDGFDMNFKHGGFAERVKKLDPQSKAAINSGNDSKPVLQILNENCESLGHGPGVEAECKAQNGRVLELYDANKPFVADKINGPGATKDAKTAADAKAGMDSKTPTSKVAPVATP